MQKTKFLNPRKMTVTAIMAAVAAVLMFLSFSIPLVPPFLKMDFSELPALIAAFSMGPISGVAVCFLKNLVNVFTTSTGGAGELCNFLLGAAFVLPAGLIYKKHRTFRGAVAGAFAGSAIMALLSVPINYFISYPAYNVFYGMSTEMVMDMYRAILPSVSTLPQALFVFNLPFTLVKGLLDTLLTFLLYKRLSPLIKGDVRK